MAEWKKLPVGLENFQEIQKSGFYYVDKTKLIEQLLENWSKVNLLPDHADLENLKHEYA